MERVRARRIVLSQILGIGEIEILPGDVTIIDGKNAAGKSSILEGFKSVLKGGKDASLRRNGAAKGEAVVEFSNSLTARRIIDDTKKGGSHDVIHPEFGKLPGAQGIIDKMLDAVALDPARLINATDEERLGIITEAVQVELDDARISEETGLPLDLVQSITSTTAGLHALELANHVRKSVAAIRLQHNKTVKEKAGAIESMRASLSGVDTTFDWANEEREKRELLNRLRSDLDLSVRAAENNCKRIESNAGQAYLEARTAKRADCDKRIAAIEQEFQTACQAEIVTRDGKVSDARSRSAMQIHAERSRIGPQIEAALVDSNDAAGKADTVRRELHSQTLLTQFELEHSEAAESSASLTAALEKLDTLKGNLLADVRIPGLDIVEGVIIVDGVPFYRLNTQKKIEVCIEIAKLRAAKAGLGTIIIDNLECLDDEHLEGFINQALKTDLQWIVGRVSNRPGINIRVINASDREAA